MSKLRIVFGPAEAAALRGHKVKLDGHTVARVEGEACEMDVDPGWHIIGVADVGHPTRDLRFYVGADQEVDCAVHPSEPRGILFNSWFQVDRVRPMSA